MGENVSIAGGEDEAGAQLEGILAQFVLTVAGGLSLLAGGEVVPPEEMEEVSLPEVRDLVGAALFIDQQGEGDLRLLAEEPGVVGVPKTDRGEGGASFLDLQLMIAQLRDMLAAEDSSIVAQEDEHRGSFFPQGPKADCLAVWIREFNGGEGGGVGGIRHRLSLTTTLRFNLADRISPRIDLLVNGHYICNIYHCGRRSIHKRTPWCCRFGQRRSRPGLLKQQSPAPIDVGIMSLDLSSRWRRPICEEFQ